MPTEGEIDVVFLDSGREPKCKADPNFPKGRPLNLVPSAVRKSCTRNLPYPAPRCGVYRIKCLACGFTAAINVGGRPDDPCMVSMPCKAQGLN
jgi:hypothetical protein